MGPRIDIIKDRLYTTQADSFARRSRGQTALWHITQALVRLLAPILSFTAHEASEVLGNPENVFLGRWHVVPTVSDAKSLSKSFAAIREVRAVVQKEIEVQRADGKLGSSLQAELAITAPADMAAELAKLGDDLKFVMITSKVSVSAGTDLTINVTPSTEQKCDRCWHYRDDDVGRHAEHPTLCGRCIDNVTGNGEVRAHA